MLELQGSLEAPYPNLSNLEMGSRGPATGGPAHGLQRPVLPSLTPLPHLPLPQLPVRGLELDVVTGPCPVLGLQWSSPPQGPAAPSQTCTRGRTHPLLCALLPSCPLFLGATSRPTSQSPSPTLRGLLFQHRWQRLAHVGRRHLGPEESAAPGWPEMS